MRAAHDTRSDDEVARDEAESAELDFAFEEVSDGTHKHFVAKHLQTGAELRRVSVPLAQYAEIASRGELAAARFAHSIWCRLRWGRNL
jgi:hypothetical protein